MSMAEEGVNIVVQYSLYEYKAVKRRYKAHSAQRSYRNRIKGKKQTQFVSTLTI